MQELTASINAKNIIDLEKAASFLSISTATVRNWVKRGYLQTHTTNNRYFHIEEIENVKAKSKMATLTNSTEEPINLKLKELLYQTNIYKTKPALMI